MWITIVLIYLKYVIGYPAPAKPYMCPAYSLDLVDFTQYVGGTYFKQLEHFAGGAYAITYSKCDKTIVIHTYPYQVF